MEKTLHHTAIRSRWGWLLRECIENKRLEMGLVWESGLG